MGIRPVPERFPITQTFRQDATIYNVGAGHGAVDFGVPVGTTVVAVAPGKVLHAGWAWDLPAASWEARWYLIRPAVGDTRTGGGIIVVIDHGPYIATYAHLNMTPLRVGDRVAEGTPIGESGNTGSSTGPHLHFSVIPEPPAWGNGFFGGVDPMPYIRGRYYVRNPYTAPDRSGSTLDGIDVSSYQPRDIVSRVSADFVIVKATEGVAYVNPHMDDQLRDALAKGKRVGLYHFATALHNSDAEADHFLAHAGPWLAKGVMPVLDWEPIGLSHYMAWATDWCKRVERRAGLAPEKVMVYMNLSVSAQGWSAYMRRHPLWLAYYGDDRQMTGYAATFTPPPTPGWSLAVWQYTQHGRLPGYAGDLDLNVSFGDPWGWSTGTGSAAGRKEWYEMSSLSPQVAAEIRKIVDTTVQKRLDLHDEYLRPRRGPGVEGKTSYANVLMWSDANLVKIHEKLDAIMAALAKVLDGGGVPEVEARELYAAVAAEVVDALRAPAPVETEQKEGA